MLAPRRNLLSAWLVCMRACIAQIQPDPGEVWVSTSLSVFGTGPVPGVNESARVTWPFDIALTTGGNAFLTDWGNETIRYVNAGTGKTTIIVETREFGRPQGVAVSRDEETLLFSTSMHTLVMVHVTEGSWQRPGVLAGGRQGYADGTGTSASFDGPAGLAFLARGDAVLVCDEHNHVIRKIMLATGLVSTFAGSAPPLGPGFVAGALGSARLHSPTGIAVSAGGRFAVFTELGNHAVRVLDAASGEVRALAGAGIAGNFDGVEDSALFSSPRGVSIVEGDGYVLVADTGNGKVRRVRVDSGSVTTVRLPEKFLYQGGLRSVACRDNVIMCLDANASALRVATLRCTKEYYRNAFACETCSDMTCRGQGLTAVPCNVTHDAHCVTCANAISIPSGASFIAGAKECAWQCDGFMQVPMSDGSSCVQSSLVAIIAIGVSVFVGLICCTALGWRFLDKQKQAESKLKGPMTNFFRRLSVVSVVPADDAMEASMLGLNAASAGRRWNDGQQPHVGAVGATGQPVDQAVSVKIQGANKQAPQGNTAAAASKTGSGAVGGWVGSAQMRRVSAPAVIMDPALHENAVTPSQLALGEIQPNHPGDDAEYARHEAAHEHDSGPVGAASPADIDARTTATRGVQYPTRRASAAGSHAAAGSQTAAGSRRMSLPSTPQPVSGGVHVGPAAAPQSSARRGSLPATPLKAAEVTASRADEASKVESITLPPRARSIKRMSKTESGKQIRRRADQHEASDENVIRTREEGAGDAGVWLGEPLGGSVAFKGVNFAGVVEDGAPPVEQLVGSRGAREAAGNGEMDLDEELSKQLSTSGKAKIVGSRRSVDGAVEMPPVRNGADAVSPNIPTSASARRRASLNMQSPNSLFSNDNEHQPPPLPSAGSGKATRLFLAEEHTSQKDSPTRVHNPPGPRIQSPSVTSPGTSRSVRRSSVA